MINKETEIIEKLLLENQGCECWSKNHGKNNGEKKHLDKVRKRDNNTCQECHTKKTISKRKMSIHHIDYNKKNNNLDNLILLCTKCHMKTNGKRKYWKEYFNNKIKKKVIV